MFSDCYTDFSLFNPFDAFSQENLLALDTEPSTNNSTATNFQITVRLIIDYGKLEKIKEDCLDSIPSPSPSVKIQIMGGKGVKLKIVGYCQ